jgi:hypothetical protein
MATTLDYVKAQLPDYADTYVKDMLSQTQALTDINQNPYQQYQGPRVAGFDPQQQQAFDAARTMSSAPENAQAVGLANTAANQALAAGKNYTTSTFQGGQFGGADAQQYMSPYTQNVTDIQTREAQRQADIATMGRNAQATGRGAFGGSRQAIMDAEAARNLATQKGDITATGLQNAYTSAQAQYNADQARRMQADTLGEQSRQYDAGVDVQGANTALQGATTLGNLGDKTFGQQKDISGLNFLYGSAQQQNEQQQMDADRQNFQAAQNYPKEQLAFRSGMLNSLPMSGNTTTSSTTPDPSGFAQGIGLLGAISGFFKKGGAVAAGGEPGLLALAASHYGRR